MPSGPNDEAFVPALQAPIALLSRNDAPEGRKAFWHDIGAAWEHQDGKGFNVVLQLVPNQGQKIVMRINEPRDSAED